MHATSTVRAVAPAVRRARLPVAARVPLLGVLAGVLAVMSVVVGAQGRVLLHQCVSADGPLAALGVRMAVLRSASECPDGALGLGPVSTGAVLLLSVALPVVATHVLLTACGLGLGVVVRRAVTAVVALLASGLVPQVVTAGVPDLPGRPCTPASGVAVRVRRDRGHDPARPRRGPPAL
ncbi:hypothetical protein [Cellulomonas xiejunii]|uniref:Integral membrane protein n=1 Tax=Cellulomonas xiejunii TaxID=2968083 RepID=A0ABY5KRT0_9CELL|nr:hypothetical protein [Cellulomonas xiejunii]MCC2313824.1 hypothetical protein [Cellulomonas xiejunii]MCC2322531.1 hypothetical protein [Cellulomonas xiejunii]UUI72568.1 hypothetical protein NP048_03645 [Cellulomonas xiejunii]